MREIPGRVRGDRPRWRPAAGVLNRLPGLLRREYRPAHRLRLGFTLLELLLVSALLVMLMAVLSPGFTQFFSREKMLRAQGDVLSFVTDVRQTAISRGVPFWLRYEGNGSAMIAGPIGGAIEKELILQNATFGFPETAERLEGEELTNAKVEWLQSPWSQAILFEVDGTAEDLPVELNVTGSSTRRLQIRGLTGRVEPVAGGTP